MSQNLLSKEESSSIQGVAIFFIVLHNLLHWVMPIAENEFYFSLDRSKQYIASIVDCNPDLWKETFSFVGWYGVAAFLFVSGYGLTRKYGSGAMAAMSTKSFLWKHFKRLFLLMAIPYIPFAIMQITSKGYAQLCLQPLLLSNLYQPSTINPGIFWFFGLIWQFYILFAILRLFMFRKPTAGWVCIVALNVISVVWMSLMPGDSPALNVVRHNSIGWVLPFTLGIGAARCPQLNSWFDTSWKCLIIFVVGSALTILANLNYYCWLFSPAFAIMAAVALTKMLAHIRPLYRLSLWMGGLSAFLFAIHPSTRLLCHSYCWDKMGSLPYIVGYLLLSIGLAYIYRIIHDKLYARWLK